MYGRLAGVAGLVAPAQVQARALARPPMRRLDCGIGSRLLGVGGASRRCSGERGPALALGRRCTSTSAKLARSKTQWKLEQALSKESRRSGGAGQYEEDHRRRLLLETSWLNYTRNALIGSVSGVALYQCIDVQRAEDMWPAVSMLGASTVFMLGGSTQYLASLFLFETNAPMVLLGVSNASLVLCFYSGALYYFVKHCEGRIAALDEDREQERERARAQDEARAQGEVLGNEADPAFKPAM